MAAVAARRLSRRGKIPEVCDRCAGWDLATVTDTFSLDATTLDPFVVRIISLSGTAAGQAVNFDETQSYQWKFLVAQAEIASFSTMKFSIDASGFQNPAGGSFSIVRGGVSNDELYLAYPAIPEPGSLALAAIGLVAAALARRRANHPRRADV